MLGPGPVREIDPKSAAWANLLLVLVTLYLPRFLALRIRMKQERAEAPKRPGALLVVMDQPAPTTAN